MSRVEITRDELHEIARAVEQVMTQLRTIEAANDIEPMKYTARLSWEALYESRQILRAKQGAMAEGKSYSTKG
ncbi:MAG: hypothetical protein HC824_07145 [Synechococcales cyanobacterium RM1_1_8]|nr:hypothetical protein [Synechococcales cyanobacterium RM1_1_8]